MSLIKCKECGKEISDKATMCPNCGYPIQQESSQKPITPTPSSPKRNGYGCLVPVIVLFLLLLIGLHIAVSQHVKDIAQNPDNAILILDADTYANISTNELFDLLGEPKSSEEWNNETSKGTFQMKIYSYDLEGMYSEFITYEDTVVKIHCFSTDEWEVKKNYKNIFKMFNVTPSKNARKIADTGSTYKFSPVSDTIAKFEVFNFNSSKNTFDTVYITYDLNYFEE